MSCHCGDCDPTQRCGYDWFDEETGHHVCECGKEFASEEDWKQHSEEKKS